MGEVDTTEADAITASLMDAIDAGADAVGLRWSTRGGSWSWRQQTDERVTVEADYGTSPSRCTFLSVLDRGADGVFPDSVRRADPDRTAFAVAFAGRRIAPDVTLRGIMVDACGMHQTVPADVSLSNLAFRGVSRPRLGRAYGHLRRSSGHDLTGFLTEAVFEAFDRVGVYWAVWHLGPTAEVKLAGSTNERIPPTAVGNRLVDLLEREAGVERRQHDHGKVSAPALVDPTRIGVFEDMTSGAGWGATGQTIRPHLSSRTWRFHEWESGADETASLLDAAGLSGRERQVLDLYDAGYGSLEIGAELGISDSTVRELYGRARKKIRAVVDESANPLSLKK